MTENKDHAAKTKSWNECRKKNSRLVKMDEQFIFDFGWDAAIKHTEHTITNMINKRKEEEGLASLHNVLIYEILDRLREDKE